MDVEDDIGVLLLTGEGRAHLSSKDFGRTFDPDAWTPHVLTRGPRKGQTVYRSRGGGYRDSLPDTHEAVGGKVVEKQAGGKGATAGPAARKAAPDKGADARAAKKVATDVVNAVRAGKASDMQKLYEAVKKTNPGLTLGEFHDHVKALHDAGYIKGQAYTKMLATLPDSGHAVYHRQEVLHGVTAGNKAGPVATPVRHRPMPGDMVDKLVAFVKAAQAKNSFDRPSLSRAHEHLAKLHPGLTAGQLHDVVRQALASKRIRLGPYTQALRTIKESELPMYLDRELKNYLDVR
jgi:hypothetical protein